ncbi:MAG TPA: S8 family serine peptidase [Bacteroidales bacterium]|nr:S8 family serine peptidase [Bacteroidales bacterium]
MFVTNHLMAGRYWVIFTDKSNSHFDPYEYFDARAIQRRIINKLPLFDSTDLPVNPDYIKAVKKITSNIRTESRWMNAVSVDASKETSEKLSALPFVASILPVQFSKSNIEAYYPLTLSPDQEKLVSGQLSSMQGNLFIKKELDGTGIRIAVFDAGYKKADQMPLLEHLFRDKKILKTWDFVRNKENVYAHNMHGTMVLACLAGRKDSIRTGLATGAEFLLARTEKWGEPFSEEENWLAAAEWADKNGANIISSSLGYTYHRYFKQDMNGQTSLVARAANMAAAKGILVVNAMGNDGKSSWGVVNTPADADSVLSVGGIDPVTGLHIGFSSFGPTSDFRTKPNVCAYGEVVSVGKKGLKTVYGTSFSTPLVAGFAACAWQSDPSLNNMELFKKIESSGSLFPYYDYAHGYGVPQAGYFISKNSSEKEVEETFTVHRKKAGIEIKISRAPTGKSEKNYLYYHLTGDNNTIIYYAVIKVTQAFSITIPESKLKDAKALEAFYRGYYLQMAIPE